MKHHFILLSLLLFLLTQTNGQVAINTDGAAPDNSAMLDVKSSSKGVLVPRMTLVQRNAISNPATGLLIFQSDGMYGFYYNSGNPVTPVWEMVGSGSGWGLNGNIGVSASNFIGTKENIGLSFRVNNQKSGSIDNTIFNTSFGYQSLNSNTNGYRNVAIGYQSLYSSAEGVENTATGYQALYSNTYGIRNVAFGAKSLFSNTTGGYNTGIGTFALQSNTDGWHNTAIGFSSLKNNTIGSDNTAIGNNALEENISGYRNVALGLGALAGNNSGTGNVSIGSASLLSNVAGNYNTVGGNDAMLQNLTGNYNSAWGSEALYQCTSNLNTAIGYHAAYSSTSGFQNTSLGANSLVNNTTGSYNTAIGYNAGSNSSNLANTTTLGIDATGTATDQVRIGNVFVNSIGGYANWSNISDGRFKTEVKENVPGLEFISQLRPVTYRLDRNAINAYIGVDAAYKGEAMSGISSGFVAQEVEIAAQQLGYDFSGVDAPKNEKDVYALRYSDFVVPLVKAVQELQQQISVLENDNKKLNVVIEELRSANIAIEKRLKMLEEN